MYVSLNKDGSIAAASACEFPGSINVNYEVVRGYDGNLYEKGKEPVKSEHEIAAELAEQRKQEILSELNRIDRASARSLRAILTAQAAGNEPESADVEMLAEHESDAKALRAELAELNA